MSITTSERSRARVLVAGCAISLLVMPLSVRFAVAGSAPKEWDGLEQRPSKSVDLLYVRPEATLAGYKRVRLEPLQVAFDKSWDPNASRVGNQRLTPEDLEKMKAGLVEEFDQVFAAELAKGGYTLTKEAGDDVLDVTPFVIDLYVAAPDKMTAGRSRTYTQEAGRMTLVAELRDSDTNQILARVVDKRNSSSGLYQPANSVTNRAAARQIVSQWASALRRALDVANGRS